MVTCRYALLLFMLKIETRIQGTNSMPFLVFRRDHLRSTSGITCGSGSFAVQSGDHFRSGDHLRRCTVFCELIKTRTKTSLDIYFYVIMESDDFKTTLEVALQFFPGIKLKRENRNCASKACLSNEKTSSSGFCRIRISDWLFRPANSHGSAVGLTIFCHFSRSHDKAPQSHGFWEKSF